MGIVIDFESGKKIAGSQEERKNSSDCAGIQVGLDLLQMQMQALEEIYKETERLVTEIGLDFSRFSALGDALYQFMKVNMMDFLDNEEDIEFSFAAEIDGVLYWTYSFTEAFDGGFDLTTAISKKVNDIWYHYGDGEWRFDPEMNE